MLPSRILNNGDHLAYIHDLSPDVNRALLLIQLTLKVDQNSGKIFDENINSWITYVFITLIYDYKKSKNLYLKFIRCWNMVIVTNLDNVSIFCLLEGWLGWSWRRMMCTPEGRKAGHAVIRDFLHFPHAFLDILKLIWVSVMSSCFY